VAANEISQHEKKTFEDNVIHLVQQRYSRLRRTVTEKGGDTTSHAFKVVGARGAASDKPTGTNAAKRRATPYADTVYNSRVALPAPFDTADSFEWDDVVRGVKDPASTLTTAMAAQMGRKFDDKIITALFANALDIEANVNAFPAANQLGGAAIAPSVALVRQVREAALEKDIDPDEEMFFVVSPNFVTTLIDDPKVSSSDYATGQALMKGGMVQGWMGFTWIVTNRLTKALVGPPAQIYGAAYTRDSMGLLVNKDVFSEIGKDPGASFSTTVYVAADAGAVRIQDDKVFRVHYLETN
jgi:hypothetical protein